MTQAKRQDLYTGIHKALRALMADLLTSAGRMDADDERDVRETLERIDEGLAVCEGHLRHENEFLHPALEARRAGTSARAAREHEEHELQFARLREAIAAVRSAAGPERSRAAYRLYLALARWMAENFLHMEHEELHHHPALWDAYTDEELRALLGRLLASVPPPEMAKVLRWMLPYQNHGERLAQLAAIRATAPRAAYEGALAVCRAHLAPPDWDKVALATRIPTAAVA
jgi:hypothetical protein